MIYLTKEKGVLSLEDAIKTSLSKNIISIKEDDSKKIERRIKDTYYNDSIIESYHLIEQSRGVHDNYIRTLKFIFVIYLSLFFTTISFFAQGFPIYSNLFNMMVLKLITYLLAEYVYKYLPFDTDIMTREPKEKNRIMSFQEWMIIVLEAFCICFTLSIPYMFILANDGSLALTYTILVITLIYTMIWYTYAAISEKAVIKNIIHSFKLKSILLTLGAILLSIILLFLPRAGFTNIGLKNYLVSILISLIPILFIEITKLARYTSRKGKKKYGNKNNKKSKRS